MNSSTPKQFLMVHNRPVLFYTIKAFLDADPDLQIVLVLPEEYVSMGQEIIDAFFDYDRIQICVGGRTRFHSVQNGLAFVQEESVVLVHDAVRCLVTPALIRKCCEEVMEFGSAIPVVESKDSVRVTIGDDNEAIERNRIKLVQTPQAFHSKMILPAFAGIDFKDKFTDEATVVEAFGLKVHLVDGEAENIKITTPGDLALAEYLLSKREEIS